MSPQTDSTWPNLLLSVVLGGLIIAGGNIAVEDRKDGFTRAAEERKLRADRDAEVRRQEADRRAAKERDELERVFERDKAAAAMLAGLADTIALLSHQQAECLFEIVLGASSFDALRKYSEASKDVLPKLSGQHIQLAKLNVKWYDVIGPLINNVLVIDTYLQNTPVNMRKDRRDARERLSELRDLVQASRSVLGLRLKNVVEGKPLSAGVPLQDQPVYDKVGQVAQRDFDARLARALR